MPITNRFWWGCVGLLLILAAPGCSLDKSLPIAAGYYTTNLNLDGEGGHPPPWIEGLLVDRQAGQVWIYLRKGDPLQVTFSIRPEEDWPAGCPGGLYSQRMEVLDLHPDPVEAGLLGLDHPILVRDCPADPYQLVLRQEGEIGGPFTACPYPEMCLYFHPPPGKDSSNQAN